MRIIKVIFLVVFIGLCTLPLVFIDRKSSTSQQENRTLATFPDFFIEGRLNGEAIKHFPKHIDSYLNDRFGFRNMAIRLINNLNYHILYKSHSERGLIGKEGWLFYIDKNDGNNFLDFKKQNLLTDEDLKFTVSKIEELNLWCEDNGIIFFLLIAPNKHSVYPEKYPFPRPDGITRTDQLLASLPDTVKDKVIFPRDYLISKKDVYDEPLYYNNGTHWNNLGASYTYSFLYPKLKYYFPNIPEIEFKNYTYTDTGEDNRSYLFGIKKYSDFITLQNVEPVNGWESYFTYVNKDYNHTITENVDKALPRALVFGDSFFQSFFKSFLASGFSYMEYIGGEWEKRNLKYIHEQKPDIFILEVCERYVVHIVNSFDFGL